MKNKSKQGTYYLGRLMLSGELNKDKLVKALESPASIEIGEHHWTVTEFKRYSESEKYFVFGKLTKYNPKGEVDIVDTSAHLESTRMVDNKREASSPFIYLPEYSGIAYLHVWNKIEQVTFVRRFKELVEKKYDNFFVECDIAAIGDLVTFYKRIAELSTIDLIQVKVRPPNPMFGPLWKSLNEYLKKRNIAEMDIREKSSKGKELISALKDLIKKAEEEDQSMVTAPDIADAAILMATDGYGHGKLQGMEGKKRVVVATSDTVKNFKFDSEPDPVKLYEMAQSVFADIAQKRHMEHDKKDN